MAKFIKTDYENAPDYITPGKEYEIIEDYGKSGDFAGDDGYWVHAYYPRSSHIDDRAWEVIERG